MSLNNTYDEINIEEYLKKLRAILVLYLRYFRYWQKIQQPLKLILGNLKY